MSQIIQGFKALNDMNVLHRDLKLANILVHFKNVDQDVIFNDIVQLKKIKKEGQLLGNVDVVIADLGFAKELEHEDLTKTVCGTPLYMAPEILKGMSYDSKVDVWSLGTVFYEMITGFTPFTGTSKEDLKRNLERGNYRLPKTIKMSLEGLDFMNCCLQHNPKDRLSWPELLKHPYLTYDYTKDIRKDQNVDNDDLLLSYNEHAGIYSIIADDDPHQKLNEKNAILINTKDPMYFQQTYEKTI